MWPDKRRQGAHLTHGTRSWAVACSAFRLNNLGEAEILLANGADLLAEHFVLRPVSLLVVTRAVGDCFASGALRQLALGNTALCALG